MWAMCYFLNRKIVAKKKERHALAQPSENNEKQQKQKTRTKTNNYKENHLKARAAGADITEAESRCEADTPKLRKNI